MNLGRWMLNMNRESVIKWKQVLESIILWFASKLPDPTRENVGYPNSLILLDIEDRFFSHYTNDSKTPLFRAAWKTLICEYDHDPHYRHIFDWFLEELVEETLKGNWKPRPPEHPPGGWVESRPNGLYRGRQFASLIKSS